MLHCAVLWCDRSMSALPLIGPAKNQLVICFFHLCTHDYLLSDYWKPSLTVGLLPRFVRQDPIVTVLPVSCLLPTDFMLFEPKQIFEQIIIAIDQSYIAGPRARAVAQNAWRRFVVRGDRCQISIDQRLHDPLAFSTISAGPGLIGRQFRQPKQAAGHEGRGRGIWITKLQPFS